MTGRGASLSDEQQDRGRGSGRLLLVAAMALALVAAAVLVLSDNARWLRLAVVSALWAALVGAFLAARYRRQVGDRENEVADLQSVYELELEREVAARREFELEFEAEARQRVQDESRDDLAKLREELSALRQNLEALLGGEVLVERVALRAESTRMRSLSDQSRLMAIGDQRIISTENERVRSLGPGPSKTATTKKVPEKPVPVSDRTELIERVVVESQSRKETRPEPPRREAARPEPARPEPGRQPNRTEPVRREPARSQQQRYQPPVVVRRDPPKAPPPPPEPPRREQPTSRVSRAELMDSMELRLNGLAPAPERRVEPLRRAEPSKPAMSKPAPPKPVPVPPKPTPPPPPKPAPEPPRRGRAAERTEMISSEPLLDRPASDSRTNLTPPRISPSSSRTNLTPVPESTGGRRRADERPSWDSVGSWESSREEPPKSGRRSAPDTDPPAGAHADGKSVSELLASLGNADSPRRRRRRED